ncbi:Peptidase M20 domain-containing protein [Lachnellula hyalina]|uniref:Peptidase M20 domain-containing protein 2 n=1 Tax=Lachnellula hyalina TaxID=1316788 RepID=A0A8H8TY72_9HELO|nr:Peptidase M20 domain-containing protein [Lachnellula hyalina]TVY26829.1 Peptidase M20 domain-containing protein [Lachnellula hyalina]
MTIMIQPSIADARNCVYETIDSRAVELRQLDRYIHNNPEPAYEEVIAHNTLSTFLEKEGFEVKRHAYGVDTSFEAEFGSGGRLVVYCAEYDCLPGIGHACGHNLIATASMAAFVGLARTLKKLRVPGRVRILGTPAEEGGGGKVKLINAGAFKDDISAAIMSHPIAAHSYEAPYTGMAGFKLIASYKFRVEFFGKGAHAAGEPWNGINALDAAVTAYNSISMLRQSIHPDERIHGVIEAGGTVPNVIPDYTRMNWYIRSPTLARASLLVVKAKACFQAAADATSCKLNYIPYVEDMEHIGEKVILKQDTPGSISSDMGNVSYEVPSFHGVFAIPAPLDVTGHHPSFAAAAGTDKAHGAAIQCAKGMSMLGWRVLTDDKIAESARKDFDSKDS